MSADPPARQGPRARHRPDDPLPVDVRDRATAWVDAGLISPEQADAIRAYEADRRDAGDGSTLAEALGYLGAALATVAVVLLVNDLLWDDLGEAGRLTLVGAAVAVPLVAGGLVADRERPALRRLVSLLWLAATVAAGGWGGLFAATVLDTGGAGTGLGVGVGLVAVGGPLWWHRRHTLQHIPVAIGATTVAVSVLSLGGGTGGDVFFAGILIWSVGVAWALLAWGGWLQPRLTGEVLGMLGTGVGAQVASVGDLRVLALVVGIISAVGLIAASVLERRVLYLALGSAGVFVFVPQLLEELFGDSLGVPLLLLLTGGVLVGVAVVLARVHREVAE